jgi:hypothetical protein
MHEELLVLQEIADTREPTEEEAEASRLPFFLTDECDEWEAVPLSVGKLGLLLLEDLVVYCGECTQTAILDGEERIEYHQKLCLYTDVDYREWPRPRICTLLEIQPTHVEKEGDAHDGESETL